jgi:predicted hydrocarbon binding protein
VLFRSTTVKKIRQGCYCRDSGKLDENKKWLKEIYSDSKDIHEFVEKVNSYVKKVANQDAGWHIKNGHLFTKYFDCSCPMLEEVDVLPAKTWCHCTAGFCKEIFDDVFGFEVDAEIIKSIKTGDDCCLIKISDKDGKPFANVLL